ncbi:Ral GTPase-activating protein subunit alpha-1 [Cichlidogyrus casuarinus]|uniref:Ral GTPase-activating protein subunit alpha-1 n=1 Tax=Cichlidogyrus casuarinus TaxID=1844966 RepID=A0ABD2PUD3_9PLAT
MSAENNSRTQLLAFRMICSSMLRKRFLNDLHDRDFINQFYQLLIEISRGKEQNLLEEMIKLCGCELFTVELHGCTLLAQEMISAAGRGLQSSFVESVASLNALIAVTHHYGTVNAFVSGVESVPCTQLRSAICQLLFQSALASPSPDIRVYAITGLTVLAQYDMKNEKILFDTVFCLLLNARLCFQSENKAALRVSAAAVNMLRIFVEHVPKLKACSELVLFVSACVNCLICLTKALCHLLLNFWALICNENCIDRIRKTFCSSLISNILEWALAIPADDMQRKLKFCQHNLVYVVIFTLNSVVQMRAEEKGLNNACIRALLDPLDPSYGLVTSSLDLLGKWESLPDNAADPLNDPNLAAQPQKDAEMDSFSAANFSLDRPVTLDVVRTAAKASLTKFLNNFDLCRVLGCNDTTMQEWFYLTPTDSMFDETASNKRHISCFDLSDERWANELVENDNIQFFALNRSIIVSVLCSSEIANTKTTRLLIRDLSGKYRWGVSEFTCFHEQNAIPASERRRKYRAISAIIRSEETIVDSRKRNRRSSGDKYKSPSYLNTWAQKHMSAGYEELQSNELDKILMDSLQDQDPKRRSLQPENVNDSASNLNGLVFDQIVAQSMIEARNLEHKATESEVSSLERSSPKLSSHALEIDCFSPARILFYNIGWASQDMSSVHILQKSSKFLRELRNFDKRTTLVALPIL